MRLEIHSKSVQCQPPPSPSHQHVMAGDGKCVGASAAMGPALGGVGGANGPGNHPQIEQGVARGKKHAYSHSTSC